MLNLKAILLLPLALQLTSCTPFKGPASDMGWTDAIPPTGNGIGRLVENNKGFKSLSTVAFHVSPDQIETLSSFDSVSIKKQTKYMAGANAAFTKITADASLERASQDLSQSSEWKIIQLRDFSTSVVDKEFAYRCITTDEYSYETSEKNSAQLKLDTSKAFGVATASIDIQGGAEGVDLTKVTIKEPNVCLSFISATLVKKRSWWGNPVSSKGIEYKGAKEFTLKTNKSGPSVEPDFGKRGVQTKPRYKLYADDSAGLATLKLQIEDRESNRTISHKIFIETLPGTWEQNYRIDTYNIETDTYSIISVDIIANRTENNEIHVSKAELTYPEYTLVRN